MTTKVHKWREPSILKELVSIGQRRYSQKEDRLSMVNGKERVVMTECIPHVTLPQRRTVVPALFPV